MIFGYICTECNTEIGYGMTYTSLVNGKCPECKGECETGYIDHDLPVVSLDPISGDFAGATDKWVKHREQKMAKERKNLENHGTYD